MPLIIPMLDDRRYQDLLDEALARIPVHTPEWTNFNQSDPGVTLLELFAFLTENLLYRCNQIPERNRKKFLTLLGIPLRSAAHAQGIVVFANQRGPLATITLNAGLEVRAGQVPFRTVNGLDVLPVEAHAYYKRAHPDPERLLAYYRQLYASYLGGILPSDPQLYETVPLDGAGVDLKDTIDRSLWIALVARPNEKPADARQKIAQRTLTLGVAPLVDESGRLLSSGGRNASGPPPSLIYEIPKLLPGGKLSAKPSERIPEYKPLPAVAVKDVLTEPGLVQIALPSEPELGLWSNVDPLESGVGDFPPAVEDTALGERVVTWLRVRAPGSLKAKLLWVGINAAFVQQRAHIAREILPEGAGEPDQAVMLGNTPVASDSLRLTVTAIGKPEQWALIDDFMNAGPEVPVWDQTRPPGSASAPKLPAKVFTLNAESGEIRFGDGTHGARPPAGAQLEAEYDYGLGREGNVASRSINAAPELPAGVTVSNPVPTWGGAAAETVAEAEKQIPRYIQHRDRLVTAADFESITKRAPLDIGRVEVVPAFDPDDPNSAPGQAPGAVTVMVIPKYDLKQPNAPAPDQLLMNTLSTYLDARRLVTTELFLRGPSYKDVWISAGVEVAAGADIAPVVQAVRSTLLQFLSPLPGNGELGWKLEKAVNPLELQAVASRVNGVSFVRKIWIAEGNGAAGENPISMKRLELPRVVGISVVAGDPIPVAELRGGRSPVATTLETVPTPVVPEVCR